MKHIYYLLLISICSISSNLTAQFGQDCDIKVQDIISPSSSITYKTLDTFDIIIQIRNFGPNNLIAGDKFLITYSIGDGTNNSISIDTVISVGTNRSLNAHQSREYTIAKDFIINGNNIFSACASVNGTTLYPNLSLIHISEPTRPY